MLDLVPLARPRRKVAHGNEKTSFIRQFLQFQFPQPQAPSIAATAVCRNQQAVRLRIEAPAFMTPPAPDRGHRKRTGVMISTDVDKSDIARKVENAIRIGPRYVWSRKVVTFHHLRLFGRKPLLANVVVVANQLFLLGVDRNDRKALRQVSLHGPVDVPKLSIPIGMVVSFLRLAIALKTVLQIVKKLRHFGMADMVPLPVQFLRDRPRTLADPSQRRFRIAPCLLFDQRLQRSNEIRICLCNRFASRTRPSDPSFSRGRAFLDLPDTFRNGFARQSTRVSDQRHSTITQCYRFTGRHDSPRALVKERPYRLKLLPQLRNRPHTCATYHYRRKLATFIYLRRLISVLGVPIGACSRSTDKLDIIAPGLNGRVYTAAWQKGDKTWRGWWLISNLVTGMTDPRVEKWRKVGVAFYSENTAHSEEAQGMTTDGQAWFLSSNNSNSIRKYDDSANLIAEIAVPQGKKGGHVGAPGCYEGWVYVPIQNPYGVWRTRTDFSAQGFVEGEKGTGRFPWCDVNPLNGRLYTTNTITGITRTGCCLRTIGTAWSAARRTISGWEIRRSISIESREASSRVMGE